MHQKPHNSIPAQASQATPAAEDFNFYGGHYPEICLPIKRTKIVETLQPGVAWRDALISQFIHFPVTLVGAALTSSCSVGVNLSFDKIR